MLRRLRSCLLVLLALAAVLALIGALMVRARMRGPYQDAKLDLLLPAPGAAEKPGGLHAGVAVRGISPPEDIWDPYTDVNGNSRFDKSVDTYEDRNGNGRFDPLWLSGFNPGRPATRINDPFTARALALRNNGVTAVLVTLDAIGIMHNDCMAIRGMVDPGLGIDHIVIAATHSHAAPDPIGLWSAPVPFISFDPAYIEFLRPAVRDVIEEAVRKLAPAEMYCAAAEVPAEGYVRDSRLPHVLDPHLYLARFVAPGTDETLATFVSWGNHPESAGGANTVASCDYPHWLREGLEKGVPGPHGCEGFGGTCLFFQGMLGGLMTQLELPVPTLGGGQVYEADSLEKARALGEKVAVLAAKTLRGPKVWKNESPELAVSARFFTAPLQPAFRLGVALGFFHRGYYPGGQARSEIDVVRIGGVWMLCMPGEIYPEIVEGGIQALPGRDYGIPPARSAAPARGHGRAHESCARARQRLYRLPHPQEPVGPARALHLWRCPRSMANGPRPAPMWREPHIAKRSNNCAGCKRSRRNRNKGIPSRTGAIARRPRYAGPAPPSRGSAA